MSYLTDYPSLVFGWLKVSASEEGHCQNHHPSLFNSRILWIPRCCLLIENERIVSHFENEEGVREAMDGRRFRRCRLDVGERAFKETLEASVTGQPSPLRESCTDLRSDGAPVTGRERSHTNPHVEPFQEAGSVSSAGSSSSKWKNLFRSKAKSNQKLEKRKSSGPLYLDVPMQGPHLLDDSPNTAPKTKRLARTFSLNRLRTQPRHNPRAARISKSAAAQPPRAYSHECLYSDGTSGTGGSYGVQDSGPWERQRFEGPYIPPCSTSYRIQRNGCVRPVHPSLVHGQEFCFAVVAGDGEPVRYYASQSEEDRRRWIQALRRTAKPDLANERHYENSLRLVIQEVKNVSPKKKYFCEILLDGTLNARTTSKAMSSASSDMLFWGEEFEFHNLSDVSTLTIQLRRDPGDKKGNKKSGGKKSQFGGVSQMAGTAVVAGSNSGLACPVAAVSISTEDIQRRSEVEKWYTAYNSAAGNPNPEAPPDPSNPQIRIKARYLRVDVLPQRCYRALQDYLSKNTLYLLRQLEAVLSVKTKEELAGTLVNIHYKIHKVDDLLAELTAHEIDNLGDESMVFRGNSFATKAVECYLKTTGEKYLEETLCCAVQEVMSCDQEVEVDPKALGDSRASLDENQRAVRRLVDLFWRRIFESQARFPIELRRAFAAMRARLGDLGRRSDLCDQVVSACIFLRYLCPAILNPVLFRLVREWPSDHRVSRAFTLVAKSVQALANFSPFGRKEDYMTFLNDFLSSETPRMRAFLGAISSPRQEGEARVHSLHREDVIDLSYELAMAHQQLAQVLTKLPEQSKANRLITQLHSILRHLKSVADSNGPYLDPVAADANLNGGVGDKARPDSQLQQLLHELNIVDDKTRRHQQQLQQRLQQGEQSHYARQPQSARAQTGRQQLQQQRRIYQQHHNHQNQQLHHFQQNHLTPQQGKTATTTGKSQQLTHGSTAKPQQQTLSSAAKPQQQTLSSAAKPQQQTQLNPNHQFPFQQAPASNPKQQAAVERNQHQPIAVSTPKGEDSTSPIRRPQNVRQSPFVVPRASEEVCSILSTDSDSCGLASPSRSSWGCEAGPADARRGSSHSDVTTNGRDRRTAASASNLTGTGVRMGTRSIQNRSASTSERSVGELEQDVRNLSEELTSIRQHCRQKEEETRLQKRQIEQKDEENRLLKRQLEEKDSHIAKLEARLTTQDERLQAALDEVTHTTVSPQYFHQHQQGYPGRRYIPSSASSGSLHSLSLAQSNSISDIAGSSSTPTATPRKPLKQTLC